MNLRISQIECRSEDDPEVARHTHARQIEASLYFCVFLRHLLPTTLPMSMSDVPGVRSFVGVGVAAAAAVGLCRVFGASSGDGLVTEFWHSAGLT